MLLRGKKLGLLLSTPPDHSGFKHGLALAEAALAEGVEVYLYCLDEAVRGVAEPRLRSMAERGLKLYGCAYAVQRRRLPFDDKTNWAGLALLSDLIGATDRFVSFN